MPDGSVSELDGKMRVGEGGVFFLSRTSVFDLFEGGVDFGLLDFGRVGVEAAEFLRFLPREHAVGEGLVGVGAHGVFLDGRGVGVVGPSAGRAGVGDLGMGGMVSFVGFIWEVISKCFRGEAFRALCCSRGSGGLIQTITLADV